MNTLSSFARSYYRWLKIATLVFVGILVLSVLPTVAQPGLVAHFSFNGTFSDQTTNANHALPTGNPSFVTDRTGATNHAIKLGGCGNPQFLRIPNSASLQVGDAMTVAFWANLDLSLGMDPGTGTCNESGRQVFFAKAGDGYGVSPPGMVGLTYPADGQQYLTFEANAGQSSVQFSKELPGNTWHHYTYVLTTTEIKLYVDAQLVSTNPTTLSFTASNQQDLYLGVLGPKSVPVLGVTSWFPLNGAMDDVRIFNRRLDATEISLVYASDDANSCAPAAASILPAGNQMICEGQSITLRGVPSADVQVQWLKNNQPIAQATLDSLVVSQAGAYRIETTRRQDAWKSEIGGFKTTMYDIQFVGGNYGWIVGENGLLLKTTNGYSWDTIPTFRKDHLLSVSFLNTQIGWLAGENGLLLKSSDGGLNWSKQNIPITGSILKIQFLNENIGFALGDGLLFKTIDSGVSWLTVKILNANEITDISFSYLNSGWVSTKNQIYKTSDGGASWTLLRSFNFDMGNYISNIFALDPDKCWFTYNRQNSNGFIINNSYISITSNGGITWNDTKISPGELPTIMIKQLKFIDSQNGYILGRYFEGVYPTRTSVIQRASGRILKTVDSGLTWETIYQNDFSAFPVALAIKSASSGIIVGKDGLIVNLSISNGGKDNTYSWNQDRTFENLYSIAVSPMGRGEAVGGDLILLKTPGLNPDQLISRHPNSSRVILEKYSFNSQWNKQEQKTGNTLYHIKYNKDYTLGWRAGYETLETTIDGGISWQYAFPIPTNSKITKVYLQSTKKGFFITGSHPADYYSTSSEFYKILNGQISTVNISYEQPNDYYSTGMLDLQFIDDNTGFITTSNGKLIKTTDGGTSWSVQLVKANTALIRCYFVTAQIGWVVGENGLIMKTSNGGQSWITQNAGSTATWNGIHFLSAQEGYVVGTQGTLAKTSDGGNSWVIIATNTRNTLNDITFTTRDKGYIVGDNGTILAFNPTLLPDCKATSAAVDVNISSGTLCESAANGAWNNVATWSCGHVPLTCDQVAINPGHVVTLSQSVQVRGVEIRQNGQLAMQGGTVLIQQ